MAASLPGGEGIRLDLADHDYDTDAILVPVPDPELSHSALVALLVAAGRDGPWHHGWTDPEDAAHARQATDRLTVILLREEHSHEPAPQPAAPETGAGTVQQHEDRGALAAATRPCRLS